MRKLSGVAALTAAAALGLLLPGLSSLAQTAAPKPGLTTLIAQAKQLEYQINALSEQYDGLRIQLSRAQEDAQVAERAITRDKAALAAGQLAVAELAAENYISAGLDPVLQALSTQDPQQFLGQASVIAELDQSRGDNVSVLSSEETRALRTGAHPAPAKDSVWPVFLS